MPTLRCNLPSPGENARGTLDEEWNSNRKDTAGMYCAISNNANNDTFVSGATKKDPCDAPAKFGAGYLESKKKRRDRSIPEKLNDSDDDAGECFVTDLGDNNDDVSVIDNEKDLEKTKSNEVAFNVNDNLKGGYDKVSKRRRTILDFYSSQSPRQDTGERSDGESTARVVKKKRPNRVAKFVALNEVARPIHVHIPLAGQGMISVVTIEAHCVESKYCLDGEPLLLEGEYPRGSKTSIARFLLGFGRYCM
jgi:hypothetical protein